MLFAAYLRELLFLGKDASWSLLWLEAFPLLLPVCHHCIYNDVRNRTIFFAFFLKWGRRRRRLCIWKVSKERKRIATIRFSLFRVVNERIYRRLWHRHSDKSRCYKASTSFVVPLVHSNVSRQYRVHELHHCCCKWILWEVHAVDECRVLPLEARHDRWERAVYAGFVALR